MFACEAAGVAPDIITLSKALTGGTLPLAATDRRDQKVFDAFWSDDPQKALMHGPTFMANALACAAANASLDLFEREPRLEQVARIAAALAQGLEPCRGLPRVKDVRVKGAIGVVELDRIDDLDSLRAAFHRRGRVRAAVRQCRLPDAGLHHRRGGPVAAPRRCSQGRRRSARMIPRSNVARRRGDGPRNPRHRMPCGENPTSSTFHSSYLSAGMKA